MHVYIFIYFLFFRNIFKLEIQYPSDYILHHIFFEDAHPYNNNNSLNSWNETKFSSLTFLDGLFALENFYNPYSELNLFGFKKNEDCLRSNLYVQLKKTVPFQ